MDFFITSETTVDVSHTELSVLIDLEDRLNRDARDLEIDGVEHIGLVLVIMNPEIAPPFPPGVVFRRARKELDIKPSVEFTAWKAADRGERAKLVAEAALAVLRTQRKKALSDHSLAALEAALGRATETSH